MPGLRPYCEVAGREGERERETEHVSGVFAFTGVEGGVSRVAGSFFY